jgi:hypothetical protein
MWVRGVVRVRRGDVVERRGVCGMSRGWVVYEYVHGGE